MRPLVYSTLLLGLLVGAAESATAPLPLYINASPVTTADDTPQINAVAFDNRSTFSVATGGGGFGGFFGTDLPFETFNTLHVTNAASGTMSGDPGFHFDHTYTGGRGPLLNFVNRGLISGGVSVWVNASNIINSGRGIEAGGRGIIHLEGDKLNLSRSVLYTGNRVSGLPPSDFDIPVVDPPVAFTPPNASTFYNGVFVDNYWASESNNLFLPALNLTPPSPRPPAHGVQVRQSSFLGAIFGNSVFGFGGVSPQNFFNSDSFQAWVFTNEVNNSVFPSTNVIQMVFVNTNGFSEGINVDVGFSRNTEFGLEVGPGFGNVASVSLTLPESDPFSGITTTNYIVLEDYLAFQPDDNLFIVPNEASAANPGAGTGRPNTYDLLTSRFTPFLGSPANATFDPIYVYNPEYLSNTVGAAYAAYSVSIAAGSNLLAAKYNINDAQTIPGLSGLPRDSITNLAGRVEIKSKSLNLDRARLRAESALIVQTDDLTGNALPTTVDAPFISYDLRSKQSDLVISNLVPRNVNRWSGDLAAYSAIWQNGITNATTTNAYMVHILVIDHTFVRTQQVVLQDLKARGKSVVISDSVNVAANLVLDTTNLTITASGSLTNPANSNIGGSNIVNLVNFTNFGNLVVSRGLTLGSDRAKPLSNIVNRGFISAANASFSSDQIILSNRLEVNQGGLLLRGRQIELLSGSSNVVLGDITLTAKDLHATNSYLEAGASGLNPFVTAAGGLVINVTNSIDDGGVSSSNFWSINQSLVLLRAPKTGNLLGTTIYSTAADFTEVIHSSAVPDGGPTPEAYSTNLAIGRLVLDGGDNCLFRFSPPPGVSNVAFYIDELVLLNNATNIEDAIVVDPGIRVYFATSTPVVPKKGVNHGANDGLRWASSYAGNFSTTNISYGLVSFSLNSALVQDSDLDSDNDGIANPSDSEPVWTYINTDLQAPIPTNSSGRRGFILTGNALVSYDNTIYINYATNTLEYTLDMTHGPWLVLTNIVTPVATTVPPQSVPFVYFDKGPTNVSRHYRMRVRVTDP